MLDEKTCLAAVVIDPPEPCVNAGIEFDLLSGSDEHIFAHGTSLFREFLLQMVKICADAVHSVTHGQFGHLIPENPRAVIAKRGNQAVFLHILCAEGFVKVINNRCFFHTKYYSTPVQIRSPIHSQTVCMHKKNASCLPFDRRKRLVLLKDLTA